MANVLVVDDNCNFRRVSQILLSSYGNRVDEAEDAQRSIKLMAQRSYDVVLMDIELNGGTGLDVLRALAGKPTQVIVITDSLSEQIREQAYCVGIFDYLEKPCETEYLLRAIDEATHEARRRRASCTTTAILVA